MSEMSCWVCSLGKAHNKCSFCGVALCDQCKDSHEEMEREMRAVDEIEVDEDEYYGDGEPEEDL
jgi:hypothetical protein